MIGAIDVENGGEPRAKLSDVERSPGALLAAPDAPRTFEIREETRRSPLSLRSKRKREADFDAANRLCYHKSHPYRR
jgi:hypothetical protein